MPTQLAMFEANTIELTRGYKTLISPQDVDLMSYKWYAHIGSTGRVYARRTLYPEKRYEHLHRVILERVIGRTLKGNERPDHINNNPLDNRRRNLRIASHAQNTHNRTASDSAGAYFHPRDKRWLANITVDGKWISLGRFDTEEEAHAAYVEASIKYYGEFSPYTNNSKP